MLSNTNFFFKPRLESFSRNVESDCPVDKFCTLVFDENLRTTRIPWLGKSSDMTGEETDILDKLLFHVLIFAETNDILAPSSLPCPDPMGRR